MTDYQPTYQDKVLLDYARTAQNRPDPWVEFECLSAGNIWRGCTNAVSPASSACTGRVFRRKPHALILKDGYKEWELPSIKHDGLWMRCLHEKGELTLFFDTKEKCVQWGGST